MIILDLEMVFSRFILKAKGKEKAGFFSPLCSQSFLTLRNKCTNNQAKEKP